MGLRDSTDASLFQAPLRPGIVPKNYQLEPLRKALALPRVNLFIADDVGLGKTIEAGLVLQELLLRQRVRRVVVSCPASVLLQWRDELAQRFGLGFVIMDKAYVNARRRERGFGVTVDDPSPLLDRSDERARLDVARSAANYAAKKEVADTPVIGPMRELAAQYPRYGYHMIQGLVENQGLAMSVDRAYRLWRVAGLQVPRKRPRKRIATGRPRSAPPNRPNHVGRSTSVFDTCADGRQVKCSP